MFHYSNEEFLLSFAASEGHPNQSDVNSEANQEKNDDLINDKLSQNRYSTKEQAMNKGCVDDIEKDNSPKRRRIVKKFSLGDCFPKNRKMSGENLDLKGNKEVKRDEEIKSDVSFEMNGDDAIEEVESGKSIENNSYIYDINEVEGSFMRKIRNLEARIKNMSLNHNTILIKMRQENQRLSKENNQYQSFVNNFCPEIMDQLNKYILVQLEKEEEMSMFSSSSNNESNDEQMPIMSKIQELKIDGGKMIETIKNYQEILIKKNEAFASILRIQESHKKTEAPIDIKKRILERKYSIPVGLQREKKLSFNANTIPIEEVKEAEVTNSSLQPERKMILK